MSRLATLLKLSLLLTLSLGVSCAHMDPVKVYSLTELGLERRQDQEVIPFFKAEGKFGCAQWEDIRTLLQIIDNCKKKVGRTTDPTSRSVIIYNMTRWGLVARDHSRWISYPYAVGDFRCVDNDELDWLLNRVDECQGI